MAALEREYALQQTPRNRRMVGPEPGGTSCTCTQRAAHSTRNACRRGGKGGRCEVSPGACVVLARIWWLGQGAPPGSPSGVADAPTGFVPLQRWWVGGWKPHMTKRIRLRERRLQRESRCELVAPDAIQRHLSRHAAAGATSSNVAGCCREIYVVFDPGTRAGSLQVGTHPCVRSSSLG